MTAKRLQQVLCTVHNLEFAFDDERVRALGKVPAVIGRCPVCSHEEFQAMAEKLEEVREHRRLLLKAINLKKLTERVR